MKRTFLVIAVVVLTACAAPPPRPSASPIPVPLAAPRLGQPFTLAMGQSATLGDAPVKITFNGVGEDSRCPKQVNCVWSGRAVLDLTVQASDGASIPITLTTLYSPENKNGRATFDGYEIVLQGVQPYPETPEQRIRREDYRAEFVVQRP